MPLAPVMSTGIMLRSSAGMVSASDKPVCQNTHSPPSCDDERALPAVATRRVCLT